MLNNFSIFDEVYEGTGTTEDEEGSKLYKGYSCIFVNDIVVQLIV